jgi:CIC family chloride channel protein
MRPAIAGLLLGAIAIWFPHIIGVGYETTSAALTGQLLLHEAIIFTLVKAAAAVITIAGRMGGGVFSPSLMLGRDVGAVLRDHRNGPLAGRVGVGDALCAGRDGRGRGGGAGAPISTTLIVFELTETGRPGSP